MSDERLFSLRNPWFRASVGTTVAVFVASVVVGFVWLPSVHRDAPFQGVWNAICSAAGVPRDWSDGTAPVKPSEQLSTVQVTPQLLSTASRLSIGRGATLALRCTMCHGARGVSGANTPNLAGQYAIVIYKQLQDFQSGARANPVMSPMVAGLSDQDMRDLAEYYEFLPRPARPHDPANPTAPDIVRLGSPLRNIPACGACHGEIGYKAGAPWLGGLPAAYTAMQLQAFASGARHNDISEQMRNIARSMTSEEIQQAADWYQGTAAKP